MLLTRTGRCQQQEVEAVIFAQGQFVQFFLKPNLSYPNLTFGGPIWANCPWANSHCQQRRESLSLLHVQNSGPGTKNISTSPDPHNRQGRVGFTNQIYKTNPFRWVLHPAVSQRIWHLSVSWEPNYDTPKTTVHHGNIAPKGLRRAPN